MYYSVCSDMLPTTLFTDKIINIFISKLTTKRLTLIDLNMCTRCYHANILYI